MNFIKTAFRYYRLRSSWLGDGGQPVASSLAHARAAVCNQCPKHDTGRPFWETLTAMVSNELRGQLKIKDDLNLKLPDPQPHICGACDCYLPLKVWAPIDRILETTDSAELDPKCWILTEKNVAK